MTGVELDWVTWQTLVQVVGKIQKEAGNGLFLKNVRLLI